MTFSKYPKFVNKPLCLLEEIFWVYPCPNIHGIKNDSPGSCICLFLFLPSRRIQQNKTKNFGVYYIFPTMVNLVFITKFCRFWLLYFMGDFRTLSSCIECSESSRIQSGLMTFFTRALKDPRELWIFMSRLFFKNTQRLLSSRREIWNLENLWATIDLQPSETPSKFLIIFLSKISLKTIWLKYYSLTPL